MKKTYSFSILFATVFALSMPTYAETVIEIFTEEYSVKPRGLYDLLLKINEATPVRGRNNIILHAQTIPDIQWRFKHTVNKKDQRCYLTDVITYAGITYILPRLDSGFEDKKLMQVWNKYFYALKKHEETHGEIVIETAKKIKEELKQLPSQNNCFTLKMLVDTTAKKVLDDSMKKQERYDRHTDHGRKEGAYLPGYL